MKGYLLHIILLICFVQQLVAQNDGVVSLDLPVRNSFKFNRYALNPTFSFVREQNRYLSFTNKKQWTQFEDAPQTNLFSYSGRLSENSGMGIGLFQQDYGVLTTFGGIVNFAYNAVLDRDSNLTFGMNLGVYNSGINQGRIQTNFDDPSLQNIPSNLLVSINPGINYGTLFLDFGVSLNNLVTYNFKTSEIIKENPEQSIQLHAMYTGYLETRGFFDESKFSTLVTTNLKKDKTVLSGLVMLTVPKGIWAQAGYNTLYGVSGGLGLNVSSNISIEYNFEKSMGDLVSFGNSHEITLAYKFNKRERYNYSDDDQEEALIIPKQKKKRFIAAKPRTTKPKPTAVKPAKETPIATEKVVVDEKTTDEDAIAKAEAEALAKQQALEAEQAKKAEEEANRLKAIADAKAKADALARQKAAEAARLKAQEDAKAKAEALAKEKAAAEAKAKEAALALARKQALEAENAKKQAEEAARLKAEEAAKMQLEQEAAKARAEEKPLDKIAQSMQNLEKVTEASKLEQQNLLSKLKATVAVKQKDLNDLKEENDLSEQGIYSEPKPFKSVSAENAAIESLKDELDNAINNQREKIAQLEKLYSERVKTIKTKNDSINTYYLKALEVLKTEQAQTTRAKAELVSTLETIKVATEIERKRRIKRAAYDNAEARYNKDRARLEAIKNNTEIASAPLEAKDFDFGDVQSNNIQIIKGVKNVNSDFYLVLAVHDDVEKRDAFLEKAVASGQKNINFFFDVATSKYYIYYESFNDLESANQAMAQKDSKPYNGKMYMVKIEN
ncbi:PorP/SprF family type IX secretion system membrane protein [Siansivirga zeaxanthinifaciens]|uniref:PorP/SprF family type IX secretion system membrane protein n=1 Tax=Siansivirga zeaxanthinifaciens TaxID=762954 RepID=UPI0005CC24E9|nr:type IX secretion system membrane protein PorP/SprF [Siansivirga zeaxanthinifaciens]